MTDPSTALREVLARMEETDNAERMPDDPALRCVFVDMRPEEFRAALAAAIAALSAPQPPAEAQPVAWQFQAGETNEGPQ